MGVSLWRKSVGPPQRFSSSARKRAYFSGDQLSLNHRRCEGIKQKRSAVHNLPAIDPDVELAPHDIDVSGRIPVGAGVGAVRIPERDVDAGDLFVLENI